jgi:hypothetical protein
MAVEVCEKRLDRTATRYIIASGEELAFLTKVLFALRFEQQYRRLRNIQAGWVPLTLFQVLNQGWTRTKDPAE